MAETPAGGQTHTPIWFVTESAQSAARRIEFIGTSEEARLLNMKDWLDRFFNAAGANWGETRAGQKPPDDLDPLIVKLPKGAWRPPDFMDFGGFPIVSDRFRRAAGQMPNTIQYLPVVLMEGSSAALARNYRLLNVLAVQPALDLQRSGHGKRRRLVVGSEVFFPKRLIKTYFLLPDTVPLTEMFRESCLPGSIMAADSLAERVMQAGCTGVEFMDPATYHVLNGVTRFRTADGIGEAVLG